MSAVWATGPVAVRRASRVHDPARGIPLPILITEVLDVLVTIREALAAWPNAAAHCGVRDHMVCLPHNLP